MTDKQKKDEIWKAVFLVEYYGARQNNSVAQATHMAVMAADEAEAAK